MTRAWLPAAGLSAACLVLAAGLETRDRSAAGESSSVIVAQEPAPEVRELLGGLAAGDRIAAWTVLGLRGRSAREIVVDFGRDDIRFSVTVAPLGTIDESAPVQTDGFGLYYGHAQPLGATVPDGAVRAILAELARRITRAETGDGQRPVSP